jgi:hypothetical protein
MIPKEFTTSIFPMNAPPPYNGSFHKGRREAILKMMPNDSALVVVGGACQIRNGDNEHPYRPGNNLFYFSGFEEADSVCILQKKTLSSHKFQQFPLGCNQLNQIGLNRLLS